MDLSHIDVVHNKLKFKCDICETTFGQNSSLNRHVRIVHDNLKKFKCQQCSKSFGRSDCLKTHIAAIHKIDE